MNECLALAKRNMCVFFLFYKIFLIRSLRMFFFYQLPIFVYGDFFYMWMLCWMEQWLFWEYFIFLMPVVNFDLWGGLKPNGQSPLVWQRLFVDDRLVRDFFQEKCQIHFEAVKRWSFCLKSQWLSGSPYYIVT